MHFFRNRIKKIDSYCKMTGLSFNSEFLLIRLIRDQSHQSFSLETDSTGRDSYSKITGLFMGFDVWHLQQTNLSKIQNKKLIPSSYNMNPSFYYLFQEKDWWLWGLWKVELTNIKKWKIILSSYNMNPSFYILFLKKNLWLLRLRLVESTKIPN